MLAEFHWLRQHTVNAKHAVELPREAVLGTPAELGVINLYADHPDFFSWTAELPIERDGVMHGLAGWFECELADGVWMTNSPLAERAIRRPQAFLPIDAAVPVRAGDAVKARVMARSTDHPIAWVVESGVVVPGLPHHATQRGHRRHPTQVEALERALSAVGRRLTVESREMA